MQALKIAFTVIPVVFTIFSSLAQETETYRTILANPAKISGFGSVINQVGFSGNNKIRGFYSVGGEGAVLFNQRFYMGIFGISSVAPSNISEVERTGQNSLNTNIRLVQTGGVVGYKFFPNRAIHLNVGTKIGSAMLIREYRTYNRDYDYNPDDVQGNLMVMPTVSVEVNLFPWMQASVGAGYNWVAGGGEVFGINPSKDLSMPTLQAGLSFGKFR